MNQVPLFHPLHLEWFHMFIILTFLFNYFDDCNACKVCHQLQENGFSHSACKEVDSIVQRICIAVQFDLSNVLINSSYQSSSYGDCYLDYHFIMNTSDDIHFTSFDLYGLTSRYSGTCQVFEALHPSLMLISSLHYLGMPTEYDHIHFSLQYSHPHPMLLI